jgi:hypothetical protein
MTPMTSFQRMPVRVWTRSDLKALKWGSILLGVGVGLFLPRGLRRYGRLIALGVGVFAIKPLMVLLREDALITQDRPQNVEVPDADELSEIDPLETAAGVKMH